MQAPQLHLTKQHSDQFAVDSNAHYTLLLQNNGDAATTDAVVIKDTLPDGITYVQGSGEGWSCSATGQTVTCTSSVVIAAGAQAPALIITVAVGANAYPSATNSAATGGGGDPECPASVDSVASRCRASDTTQVAKASAATVNKTVSPTGPVLPGTELTYTLQLTVTESKTTEEITLSDTLDQAVTFDQFTDTGVFTCQPPGSKLSCSLPPGQAPATYTVSYKVKVKDTASGTIVNQVVASTPSGQHTPACQSCSTQTAVTAPAITVTKSVDPTGQVKPGATLTYTLSATVEHSKTTEVLTLTDHFGQGLVFDRVIDAGPFRCHDALQCELAAGTLPGTYTVRYTATVQANATGTVKNRVVAANPEGGDPPPTCQSCSSENTVAPTSLVVRKEVTPVGRVLPGALLTYTVTTEVKESATSQVLTLEDTLGPGLQFEQVTDSGAYHCHDAVTCELPAATIVGTYRVSYTARVKPDASGTLSNAIKASNPPGGDPDPVCERCSVTSQVENTGVSVSKSVTPTGTVSPGTTLHYTLDVEVSQSVTTQAVVLTDTLGDGLQFGEVTDAGPMHCQDALVCQLAARTLPGHYAVHYTAIVKADAAGVVTNTVSAAKEAGSQGDDPDPVCSTCTSQNPVTPARIAVSQSSDPASGVEVTPNQDIHYVLKADVSQAYTNGPLKITATLQGPAELVGPLPPGCQQQGQTITCELAAGTPPGHYSWPYTAKVAHNATGQIQEQVSTQGTGTNQSSCTDCAAHHPLIPARVSVGQTSDVADGTPVVIGQQIHHTLQANVAGTATTTPTTVRQQLGAGMRLVGPVPTGCQVEGAELVCTLPAGAQPGDYNWAFTTEITDEATDAVHSQIVADGAHTTCSGCHYTYPLLRPVITVNKSADPESNQSVAPGQTLTYTLKVTLAKASSVAELVLDDTLSSNQTLVTPLPPGCSGHGQHAICRLPAKTQPGIYSFVYQATVNPDATGHITNSVLPSGADHPICDPSCATEHVVVDQWQIRLLKTAAVRAVHVGDLVQYTLTLENTGDTDFHGIIADALPAGFRYAAGSLTSDDMDHAAQPFASSSLRLTGVDVAGHGGKATYTYQLHVGAGIRPGIHVNTAMVMTNAGMQSSNRSSAAVTSTADSVMDESIIFGTVFDDRDGDGWQDSAAANGLFVKGGFAPSAYIAGTTEVDHGRGLIRQADASAPLLHGIALGDLSGRQSPLDPARAHQIIIRQRLRSPQFTDDFVLTTAEGIQVRMTAAGQTQQLRTRSTRRSDHSARIDVSRRVTPHGQQGYDVDYIIVNRAIDERGIPGVRIGTVEGLMIETDQYGRFHVEGIAVGTNPRGHNVIVKVDPTTLAKGAVLTTSNPLVRRVTPGLPVRFDFGVHLTPERSEDDVPADETIDQSLSQPALPGKQTLWQCLSGSADWNTVFWHDSAQRSWLSSDRCDSVERASRTSSRLFAQARVSTNPEDGLALRWPVRPPVPMNWAWNERGGP